MKLKSRKIISMALVFFMMLTILPLAPVTAAAGTEIDTIEISGVEAPIPGDLVTGTPSGTTPSDANYSIVSGSWTNKHNQDLPSIGLTTFDKGYYAWAQFKIKAADGYSFPADNSSITLIVNGGLLEGEIWGWEDTERYVNVKDLIVNPVYTVDDVTIDGTKGSPIAPTEITIKAKGATFGSSVSIEITNLPAGLSQSTQRVDDTTAKITVTGTPTEVSTSAILFNSTYIKNNENAKFNITAPAVVPLTGSVEISGTAKYDETLTAVVTGTNNTGTLKYTWTRDGIAISGANEATYKLTESDVGKVVSVVVNSTNETGDLTCAGKLVEKADGPAAPTGLIGVKPSVGGGNDGKITGVDNTMIWSQKKEFTTFFYCSGTEITDLMAGTYYVRFFETSTHKASDYVTVVVPDGAAAYDVTFDVKNVEHSGDSKAYADEDYVVQFTPKAGLSLEKSDITVQVNSVAIDTWTFNDVTDTVTIPKASITGNVKITVALYEVTYEVSDATHNGGNKAAVGADFVVKFTPAEGYRMTVEHIVVKVNGSTTYEWDFDTETNTLTISKEVITGDVDITAHAEEIETEWDVTYEVSDATHNGADKAAVGEDFVVEFTPAEGYRMTVRQMVVKINGSTTYEWDFDTETNTLTISKEVITGDVDITAHAEKIPTEWDVTYEVSDATHNGANKAKVGEDFVVKFTPAEGYEMTITQMVVKVNGSTNYTDWTFDTATNTLTISKDVINGDVEITAHAKKIPTEWAVTYDVTDATHNGANKAKVGEDFVVKFTPAEGYRMTVRHIVVKINGSTTYEWDFDTETNTLTISKEVITGDVDITAHAKKIPTEWAVTYEVSDATHNGADKAKVGEDFVVKFTPAKGYKMTVTQMVVKVNGSTTYEWDFDTETNTLTISKEVITGDVEITAHAKKISSGGSYGGGSYVVPDKDADSKLRIVMQINNKNILVNGVTKVNDVAPVIVGDRTLVPIRVVTELLGGSADWDNATRTVTLKIDGKTMNMTIGKPIPGFGTSAVIMNDRTYVPVRYVMEKLGAEVEWINATRQIIIEK